MKKIAFIYLPVFFYYKSFSIFIAVDSFMKNSQCPFFGYNGQP